MKSFFVLIVWPFILAMLVLAAPPVRADVWVVASVTSFHASAEHFNAENFGLGAEYTRGAWSAMAGAYENSVYRPSTYGLAGYAPFVLGPFRFGGVAGVVTGYPGLNNGGVGPAAGGLVRLEFERFGANAVIIPKVTNRSPWTLGVQAKFRAM